MERAVRGHHIYKSVWHPVLGEQLTLERENSNSHDRHAVSVMKDASYYRWPRTPRALDCSPFFAIFVVVFHHLKLLLSAIALPCLLQHGFHENLLFHHFNRMIFDTLIITGTDVHIIHALVMRMRLITVWETLLKLYAKHKINA